MGQQLNVDYVLSGNLTLFGERASVIVELTNANTMSVVWADKIDSKVDELIALRTQLATRIANSIEQRIQTEEARLSDTLATEHLDAWTTYFRGLRHVNRFNRHDNDVGRHLFEQAIELDPNFALAHAGRSFAHFQSAFLGYDSELNQHRTEALRSAERSFELDSLDPVVNLTMGRAKYLHGEWEQANPWFERCTTICPNNALAYYNQALISTVSGSTDTTHDLSEKALTLSPIDPLQYAFLATRALGHLSNDTFESAAYWGEQAANAPRAHHIIYAIAAATSAAAGMQERARQRAIELSQRVPGFSSRHFFQAIPVHMTLREKLTSLFVDLGFE